MQDWEKAAFARMPEFFEDALNVSQAPPKNDKDHGGQNEPKQRHETYKSPNPGNDFFFF